MIADRKRAREIAETLGYFWMPCPICGENFAGFEGGRPGLVDTPSAGRMHCQKAECEAAAAAYNERRWGKQHSTNDNVMRWMAKAGTMRQVAQIAASATEQHVIRMRTILKAAANDEPGVPRSEEPSPTFRVMQAATELLEALCGECPADSEDSLVLAVRAWIEDRKEPIYGWRADHPEEKARADERLRRWRTTWERVARESTSPVMSPVTFKGSLTIK